jgi:NSS family neurotransmitter:Na+ symporter
MREKLKSRLGFLMLAAGCAVGLGNVWRFPFVVGQNGGAAFVLIYIAFLFLFGFPLLIAELSLGRASKLGISGALKNLTTKPSSRRAWGVIGTVIFSGNLLLMLYYTDVGGWLLNFMSSYIINSPPPNFSTMLADKISCTIFMALAVSISTIVCISGLRKGVERITKWMMILLLAILGILAVKALTLEGAAQGLQFYLKPDWSKIAANPAKVLFEAMGQAFFTLSVGVGCMAIFGSYIDKDRALLGESVTIASLDTFVAIAAGLIIFPACFTYGFTFNELSDGGPGLLFIILPLVFANMPGGRIWGILFFLFMSFAAISTVLAVFQNIVSCTQDLNKTTQKAKKWQICLISGIALLEQPFVKDDSMTVAQLLTSKIATIGEKIEIKRFVRYQIG